MKVHDLPDCVGGSRIQVSSSFKFSRARVSPARRRDRRRESDYKGWREETLIVALAAARPAGRRVTERRVTERRVTEPDGTRVCLPGTRVGHAVTRRVFAERRALGG
jgi:hypothetical protein